MKKIRLKNCRVRVRHVKKFGKHGGDFGEFNEIKNKRFNQFFDIKLSLKKNKRLSVYFRTLVHELFHFAFHIIYLIYGKKVTTSSEHDFIEVLEDSVLSNIYILKFNKRLKSKKKVGIDG